MIMAKAIRRVGVIGAGVMGSGIAAHLASAGIEAVLLDIVPPNLADAATQSHAARSAFAVGGLEKALKNKPALFMHKSAARLVRTGNLEDDLALLAGCDLVVEAIVERLDIKQALFAKLDGLVPAHCIVASNTSGLRIHDMVQGRSEGFRKNFLVMHFFNPVRYMKLLELVAGPETDPATVRRIADFGANQLGKGIVYGKDTPNFVGNRIGTHAMLGGIHLMIEMGLQPEDVDNLTGVPMGHPKSASFRTADMVGLDTLVHVADNCHAALTDDEDRAVFAIPAFIRAMVGQKLLGDKTKGGFYKKVGKDIQTIDPQSLAYRAKGGDEAIAKATKGLSKIEDVRERVRKLVAADGKVGAFAWRAISASLAYSARRIPEIADSIVAIDDAMRWGYNWELGPFETWDALGFRATAERMKAEGIALPASIDTMLAKGAESFYREDGTVWDLTRGEYVARPRPPRTLTLQEARAQGAGGTKTPVFANPGVEAFDLGDGVLGLTFKTKANSIDPDVIQGIYDAVDRAESDFRALVIANNGEHFCVGANLFGVVMAAGQKQWDQLAQMIRGYQYATQRMKYAAVPVVAAPYGMTLGGGLELCYGATAVQAAAETYSGLVEVGVGLIPGGAGTLNMLWRALDAQPEGATVNTYDVVTQVFKNIALAKVATSAQEAQELGFFRKSDGISFDRAQQLHHAKHRAIGLAEAGHHAPIPRAFKLPGESGTATLSMMVDTLVAGGFASEHDALIARKLANVLCGGASGASKDVTEDEMLDLEREAFLSLCGEPKSQERMQFMLMNNKPLRN
jgi:3-hydroxyacyl-CoA dehydrogenase